MPLRMNTRSAMPPSPAVLADALVRRAYGRELPNPSEWPSIEPWHDVAAEVLIPSAQRIARNALSCEELLTDNMGVALHDPEGIEVGRLWSCRGDNKWLSAFTSTSRDPKAALDEWLAWAHSGSTPPRHLLTLVDAHIPVIGPTVFGMRSNQQPRPGPFDTLHHAAHHAAVISLVETCVLQRRNPTAFLTDLLAKELS